MIRRYQKAPVVGFVPLKKDERVHLMVPKCGTNTMAEVLEKRNGWERFKEKMFDPGWEYTALVRHPVERWVSGAMQYEQDGRQRQHGPIDQAIEKMVFDCHTAPQHLWLKGFIEVDLTLFKLEHIDKFWEHVDVSGWRQVHKQKRIYFPGRKRLELEPWHKERILEYYAEDLKLYESAL